MEKSFPVNTCLEVRDVGKRFGDRAVLAEINFTLREGEVLGIIGPNGAGKTTLFNIIAGWQTPARGSVTLWGKNITAWPPHRRCLAGMAQTFQSPQIFPKMNVLENVMLGAWFGRESAPDETGAREQSLLFLDMVGLAGKEDHPAGKLTLMQRRLLELARALATEPRLLLLDELAAGLSLRAVKQLTELILQLRDRGLTLLLTDHLLHLVVPVSDRILALDQGKIIAEGSPEALLHDPQVESAYLGIKDPAGEEG